MKLLIWLFKEIFTFFRRPKYIHRVLLVVPLSALASHLFYIYNAMPEGYIYTSPELTAISLGVFIYSIMIGWCLMSGEMTFDLFGRFIIICGWSIVGDMILIGSDVFGGANLFFLSFAFFGLSILLIWALTGLKYEHFKAKYVEPKLKKFKLFFDKDEKKDNILAIADRDNAINE